MGRKPNPKPDDAEQSKRFIDTAREVEADDETVDQVLLSDNHSANFLAKWVYPGGILLDGFVDGLDTSVRIARYRWHPAAKGATNRRRRCIFNSVKMRIGARWLTG